MRKSKLYVHGEPGVTNQPSSPVEFNKQSVFDNKSLASKFAYGQAQTVKKNEFEKATAVQQVIQVFGRRMSSESLGLSGRIMTTSPHSSEMDEGELSA